MREFLDDILEFIGSESLTDEEFATIDSELSDEYSKEVYLALRAVLEERENVSDKVTRLGHFFAAKGLVESEIESTPTPTSNIFIGGAL